MRPCAGAVPGNTKISVALCPGVKCDAADRRTPSRQGGSFGTGAVRGVDLSEVALAEPSTTSTVSTPRGGAALLGGRPVRIVALRRAGFFSPRDVIYTPPAMTRGVK